MKATEQLKHEHEAVLLMLHILESVSERLEKGEFVDTAHIDSIIDFLKIFVDKCHHGKEELLLFPLLESKGIHKEGGPIGVMLTEHNSGREIVKNLAEENQKKYKGDKGADYRLKENIDRYISLLNMHISKENNILFAIADGKLTSSEQAQLFDEFEELEEKEIGQGKHEELHKMLKQLSTIYLH